MTRLRRHLTYANVISTLCLFLLLGGGTAYALDGSNTVFTDDIVNGDVKVDDIGQGAVATDEIANGQVKAADIGDGEVKTAELATGAVRSIDVLDASLTGIDIANNSLKGADVDESTLNIGDAARAYAYVSATTCTGTPGTCTAAQSKGISSVTRESTGQYCVTAPGINPRETPAAVTVEWQGTADPEGNASAMYDGGICGPLDQQGFKVITERQPNVTVNAGGGTLNQTAVGPADYADDVAFTIVIP